MAERGPLVAFIVPFVIIDVLDYAELEYLWSRCFGQQRFRAMRPSPGAGPGLVAPFGMAPSLGLYGTWFFPGHGGLPE